MTVFVTLGQSIERHELKYAVPASAVEPICKFIAPYCSLDHYSSLNPDNTYLVNSLYFDTQGLEFLKQRLYGKDGRFNVRVRCYGDQGEPPYFLEIKQKLGVLSKKYRATVDENEWPAILLDPNFRIDEQKPEKERVALERFLRIATAYSVEPQLLTQYTRRAYFSTVDEYARVTLDMKMKYRKQNHHSLAPGDDMISYDNETIYAKDMYSDGVVILELKSNIGEVPMWMIDLITKFELKQQGFSKYASSFLTSHFDDGLQYMTGDRISSFQSY